MQKQSQNGARLLRDAKRRQEVSSVVAQLLLCLGFLGVKWKRQWVEPQRGKEERKEREKRERAAESQTQEGRGERKKGGKEGRKRERDR